MVKNLLYILLLNLLIQPTSVISQETPGMMWSVIDKEEIPSEVFDQAFIDLLIDFFENGGPAPLYVRWVYFLRFHPEQSEKFGYWNDSIAVAIPREPDSTEIAHLYIGGGAGSMGFTTPDSTNFQASGTNLDYPLSTMQFIWRNEGDLPEDNSAGGGFSNMPKRYEVYGFKGSSKYGFLIQFVDPIYHPEIVGTRQAQQIDFSMFPNPVTEDILYISVDSESRSSNWLVKIYSTDGRFIKHQLINGMNQLIVSVSGLNEGNYILTLSDGDKFGALPFIKT